MLKGLAIAMVVLNFALLLYIYIPNEKTLAEVASKNPGNDYEVFYEDLGSFFQKKFRYVTGEKISILYSEDSEALYVYSKKGPILAYANSSIEVYPAGFDGNFHEVTPGMFYYDRGVNVVSYYNGTELKIGSSSLHVDLA